jgi:flagellar biosynthetic protein FlhB
MFSLRSLVRLLMGVFKLAALGTVLLLTVWAERFNILNLVDQEFIQIVKYLIELLFVLAFRAALVILLIAILDYGYQRWQYEMDLRMSRQEVKEEMKRYEGDPKIKRRRYAIQLRLAMQRMLQRVPRATVVITNPTEIAVALEYEQERMEAPVVVAKGTGYVADRIRAIAMEYEIPIVQRPPLAQALYKATEVGQVIPFELYEAVAEVIAYVYRLKNQGVAA